MTRTLIVLRHGKSDWGAAYASDHDRSLKKRGREAAATIGKYLRRTGQVPDLLITSPAVRARSTAELAAEAGEWGCPVRIEPRFYASDVAAMLEVVRAVDDAVECLVVVGHEPTLSDLIGELSGAAAPAFPTAAMARIDFELDGWGQVARGEGSLEWLVTPRELRARGE